MGVTVGRGKIRGDMLLGAPQQIDDRRRRFCFLRIERGGEYNKECEQFGYFDHIFFI
jgi:hypothetical protein